jgi:hypothetical protein
MALDGRVTTTMHAIDTDNAQRRLTVTAPLILHGVAKVKGAPMSNCHFALAAIALLASTAPAMAQNWAAYGQPGTCGYYTNSSGHLVPRPCGDWHYQAPPPGSTARCADGTYSYSEHPAAPGTCSHHGGRIP